MLLTYIDKIDKIKYTYVVQYYVNNIGIVNEKIRSKKDLIKFIKRVRAKGNFARVKTIYKHVTELI